MHVKVCLRHKHCGYWRATKCKYTRCKNIKTSQVPKSYKAPVFLEQLVAGLSDQGTVSLECKVVSDFWEGLQIGHFSLKKRTFFLWGKMSLEIYSWPLTKLLFRWLEFPLLPCGGSETGRRLGFQIGRKQIWSISPPNTIFNHLS